MNINEITPEGANELIRSGAILIDVREKDEVKQMWFDLPDTLYKPYSSFDDNYTDIPKNKKLVIACHLGVRSFRVSQFLLVQGWNPENVFSLKGGIEAWKAAKLPLKLASRSFSMAKPKSNGCCGGASGSCC
jgi:rhodanese-related sulfurtransferase